MAEYSFSTTVERYVVGGRVTLSGTVSISAGVVRFRGGILGTNYWVGSVNVSYSGGGGKTYTCDSLGSFYTEGDIIAYAVNKENQVTFSGVDKDGHPLLFPDNGGATSYTVGPEYVNSLPTASITVPKLFAGKDAKITWTTSDADGDTVYIKSLVRYIKMPGDTKFTAQKTLISTDTTATSFIDTIPEDAGGAQIFYYLGFTDKIGGTQYRQSSEETVSSNTAPTEPGTLLVSGDVSGSVVSGGGKLNISWTSSIDTDGNLAGYELERQENGGSWKNIFTGSARETETVVTEGIETLRFRVRAYDTMGAKSGYTTGTRYTVNNNKAPIITISTSITGGSIGTYPNDEKESPVLTYTVTDPENTVMTVEEFMDGVLLRRETATGADARMISFTPDAWIRVINGGHVLRIVATDADGSVGTAEVRFTKDVDRIEIQLKPDVNRESDTRPSIIMVNVQGLMPDGSVLKVEAANNANDAEPAWEDMTSAVVSRGKHIFANEVKTAEKWAVNVRITLERGEAESVCAITSVGGNWK